MKLTQLFESAPVKLTAKNDRLYLGGTMLMRFYPAGDMDIVPWPFKESEYWTREKWNKTLARALFDARETGDLPGDAKSVLLPDGKEFVIDKFVNEASSTGDDGKVRTFTDKSFEKWLRQNDFDDELIDDWNDLLIGVAESNEWVELCNSFLKHHKIPFSCLDVIPDGGGTKWKMIET